MDSIQAELDKLTGRSNLSKVATDIDACIKQLEAARNSITQGPFLCPFSGTVLT
jgi:hypothetical protein